MALGQDQVGTRGIYRAALPRAIAIGRSDQLRSKAYNKAAGMKPAADTDQTSAKVTYGPYARHLRRLQRAK